MRALLTITVSKLMLAGCASVPPGYDKSAVPDATAAMRQATVLCENQQTASKYTACEVAAQRDFVLAIHLTKMDAFDTYAAKMMALAAAREAGRVSRNQLRARATSIRNDYREACNCSLTGHRPYEYSAFVPSSAARGTTLLATLGPLDKRLRAHPRKPLTGQGDPRNGIVPIAA